MTPRRDSPSLAARLASSLPPLAQHVLVLLVVLGLAVAEAARAAKSREVRDAMYLAVAHAFDARGVPLALRPSHYHGGDRAEAKGALAMGVELNRRRGSPLRPPRTPPPAIQMVNP